MRSSPADTGGADGRAMGATGTAATGGRTTLAVFFLAVAFVRRATFFFFATFLRAFFAPFLATFLLVFFAALRRVFFATFLRAFLLTFLRATGFRRVTLRAFFVRFPFFARLPFFFAAMVLSSVEQVVPVLMLAHSLNTNTQRARIKCRNAIFGAQSTPTWQRMRPASRQVLHEDLPLAPACLKRGATRG